MFGVVHNMKALITGVCTVNVKGKKSEDKIEEIEKKDIKLTKNKEMKKKSKKKKNSESDYKNNEKNSDKKKKTTQKREFKVKTK